MEEEVYSFETPHRKKLGSEVYTGILLFSIAFVLMLIVSFITLANPPKKFPVDSTVTFNKNESLSSLTKELDERGYIRSPFLFKLYIKFSGREGKIAAGEYYFDKPLPVGELAYRFARGTYSQKGIKVTIPEGSNNVEIAKIVNQKIPAITVKDFVNRASTSEGFLFPETYFFDKNVTSDIVIKRMQDEYTKKVLPVFVPSGVTEKKNQYQILILASLLEEEGKTVADKRRIAGVLLRRTKVGMPLQVDATINYIKGEASYVTLNDLELVSKYNTYRNKGLPPTPISNPGLESIQAALSPVDDGSLYYLTGKNGTFYFAKTFEEHKRNKELYLR